MLSQTIDIPGPGSYQQDDKFGSNSKKYTIGSKKQQSYETLSPGPGAYNTKDNLTKSAVASYRQAQSKRTDVVSKERLNSPGPGNYSFDGKTVGKDVPSYTIGTKRNNQERSMSPGPGAYDGNKDVVKDKVRTF